jgi:hypothetical protein
VAGLYISATYFPAQEPWQRLVVALVAGILGAILAVSLQKVAVAVAGFLVGGYGLLTLLQAFGLQLGGAGQITDGNNLVWIIFVVGGVVGAILVVVLFEWALIGLSAWAGATLITQALDLRSGLSALVFLALLILGVIIQVATDQMEKRSRAKKEKSEENA